MAEVAERVKALVEPVADAQGLELVDVEHGGGLLRVTLDRDGGIDLDAITAASERISELLDLHDPVPGRYTLEVTSPGVERPLQNAAQFRRFVGSLVNVKTRSHVEGERRIEAVLDDADDRGIEIAGRRLAYDDIERARTVFQWGPSGKPGKSAPKKPASKKTATS